MIVFLQLGQKKVWHYFKISRRNIASIDINYIMNVGKKLSALCFLNVNVYCFVLNYNC